jgi:hypothetical protein
MQGSQYICAFENAETTTAVAMNLQAGEKTQLGGVSAQPQPFEIKTSQNNALKRHCLVSSYSCKEVNIFAHSKMPKQQQPWQRINKQERKHSLEGLSPRPGPML